MSVKKNSIINIIGNVIPIPVSLLVVPLFLDAIGLERFGILAIFFALLGYFGLLDFGFSRATAQRIAASKNGAKEGRFEIVATATLLVLGIGFVGFLLIGPVVWLISSHFIDIDPIPKSEITTASLWLSLAVPILLISGVFSGVLQGLSRFIDINVVNVFNTVLIQVSPLLAAWYVSPTLDVVMPVAILVRIMSLLIIICLVHRQISLSGNWKINKTLARELFSFGGWVTITSINSLVMNTLDKVIIGAVMGAGAISFYVVPYNLVNRFTLFSSALQSALFPRIAGTSYSEEANDLAMRGVLAIAGVFAPCFLIGGFIFKGFLTVWIGPDFAEVAAAVGIVLTTGFWFNCIAGISYTFLQATGRPDISAKCHTAIVTPYLLLLAVLLSEYGIMGAAIAWFVMAFANFLLLTYFAFKGRVLFWIKIFSLSLIMFVSLAFNLLYQGYELEKLAFFGVLLFICSVISVLVVPAEVFTLLPGSRMFVRRIKGKS